MMNAQIQKALGEQQRAREIEAEVGRIQSLITDAGYQTFGGDYYAIVGMAKSEGLSIEDAISKHKEAEQAKIDAFVQGQRGGSSRFPTQSGSAGTPPPGGGEQPEWLGDTKKTNDAVREWLRARAGQ